jgi:hypothetical protein
MPIAPPILCKHPMLDEIESLAADPKKLATMVADIAAGGDPQTRLGKIESSGLLDRYGDGEKPKARARLLGSWGDERTLLHISDSLGAALAKVQSSKKPLRAWWIAGATQAGIHCAVSDDANAVYFLLLTPPMDDGTVASKATFDDPFLQRLKAQAEDFKNFTDPL